MKALVSLSLVLLLGCGHHQATKPAARANSGIRPSGESRQLERVQNIHLVRGPAQIPRPEITAVAFSPDGKQALVGENRGGPELWDLDNGKKVRTLWGHGSEVTGIAFLADGRRAIAVYQNYQAVMWDLTTGKELPTFKGVKEEMASVAVSPNGKWALTGGRWGAVHLWDIAQGKIFRSFRGHSWPVDAVTFSPDSRYAASAGYDNTIRVWKLASGKAVRVLRGYRLPYRPRVSIASSRTGRYLVSAGGTVKLWEVATGKQVRVLGGEESGALWAAFLPGDRQVLYADCPELPPHVVNLRTGGWGKPIRWYEENYSGRAALSPDGKRALFFRGELLVVWDLQAGEEILTLRGPLSREPPVFAVAFSKGGKKAISVSGSTLVVWDTSTWKVVRTISAEEGSWLTCAALSPDGKQAWIGGDFKVRLWAIDTGEKVWEKEIHKNAVSCVDLSSDGKRAVSADSDGVAILWDLVKKQEIRRITEPGMIVSAALLPDGKRLWVSCGTLTLWDLTSLWAIATDRRIRTFSTKGVRESIYTLAFSPDGKLALAGMGGQKLKLLNVATGREVRTLAPKYCPKEDRRGRRP
jgi:WD40 repeat protein